MLSYSDGTWSISKLSDPPLDQIPHFASQGVNLLRIRMFRIQNLSFRFWIIYDPLAFAWQLATPTLGGTLASNFVARYDKIVQAALAASTKPYVIVDLVGYYHIGEICHGD